MVREAGNLGRFAAGLPEGTMPCCPDERQGWGIHRAPCEAWRMLRAAVLLAALALPACAAPPPAAAPPKGPAPAAAGLPLQLLKMPPGFRIEVFAADLKDARSLARGEKGTIFVGSRQTGMVRAVRDTNGDFRADETFVLARDLFMPNGVAVKDGALYVAEVNRILRFDGIEASLSAPPAPVVVKADYPRDEWHGWKFIAFGPDGRLYVPVGAPCNVCEREDPYASITSIKPDGSDLQVVARGVRNSVGFAWSPKTGELWFTDNGRDMLGDDVPSDELNRVRAAGLHFGFPYCHQGDVADPDFGKARKCAEFEPPASKPGAHVATLGMRFYQGAMLPAKYRGAILVAEHGSWNRSVPDGYRVVAFFLDETGTKVTGSEVLVEGFLQGGKPWGRPVDLLELPDGSVLISDDHAGVIYRMSWGDAGR